MYWGSNVQRWGRKTQAECQIADLINRVIPLLNGLVRSWGPGGKCRSQCTHLGRFVSCLGVSTLCFCSGEVSSSPCLGYRWHVPKFGWPGMDREGHLAATGAASLCSTLLPDAFCVPWTVPPLWCLFAMPASASEPANYKLQHLQCKINFYIAKHLLK